jgi:hypothetical protein
LNALELKGTNMPTLLGSAPMAKRETMPVRLETEAMAAAKTAASLKGESLSAYVSRITLECANRDIDEFAQARVQRPTKGPKPKGAK